MPTKVFSSDKARTRWRDIIDTAVAGNDVIIERYGKPTVAIIAYRDFVELEKQLQDLRDIREAEIALEEWRRNPESFRPWEEVREELLDPDSDA